MLQSIRFLVVVASLPLALVAAETPNLTLDQALATTEGVNVSILLSREAAAQAIEAANQSRVAVLPNVSGSLAERRSRAVSFAGKTAIISPAANRFDGQLNGTYSVFNAQQLEQYRSAKKGVEVAQANYRATVQQIVADVANAYFTHLRNLRRLDVLNANIDRAQTLFELARSQLNHGVATQIDVTRAEEQLAQAQVARLQQQTTLVQSELFLKRLLDYDMTRPLVLADFQVRRMEPGVLAVADEKTAFETRADLLAQQKAVEQSKLDVKSATYQRLPALGLTGEYGLASVDFDDSGKKETWLAGATISVPIFDGLKAGADRRAALSRQRAQEFRLRSLELQISAELRLAHQDASSRNAQVTVAEKGQQLGRDELRLAQERYRAGAADNREVVEAQNELAVAEDTLVEAVYQYNLSRVELARARGEVRTMLTEKAP